MQLLLRMNKKLDIGWKMTNSNCQKCSGITIADPNKITQYYCPKCDKNFQFQAEENQQAHQNLYLDQYSQKNQQDYLNQIIAQSGVFEKPQKKNINNNDISFNSINYRQIQKKTNNVSKKLGQKLIQGWAMLSNSCEDCNIPLMKSKKGEKICFGCQKDYAKIEAEAKVQAENKKLTKQNSLIKPNPKIQTKTIKKQENIQTLPTKKLNIQVSIDKIQIIERIQSKALLFLQRRLQNLVQQNDLSGVEKIIEVLSKIKSCN